MAESGELALNASVTPGWVLPGHAQHQGSDGLWPAEPSLRSIPGGHGPTRSHRARPALRTAHPLTQAPAPTTESRSTGTAGPSGAPACPTPVAPRSRSETLSEDTVRALRKIEARLAGMDPAEKQKQIEAILSNFTRYLTELIQEARTAEEARELTLDALKHLELVKEMAELALRAREEET